MSVTSIPAFESVHVLVMGDVMLDRYWYGETSRISPEAPVPVVHVRDVEERPGGAANLAVNLTMLGARATLMGMVGQDEAAAALDDLLRAHRVNCLLERCTTCSTITKLRVLSRHQQLIRLDFEDALNREEMALPVAPVGPILSAVDLVVLSDYGKGTLQAAPAIIEAARRVHRPVLVDPKGRDFSKYRGATLMTPNLSEFEAVVGPCRDLEDLVVRGRQLCADLDLGALLVTRSEHGMSLIQPEAPPLHLAARAREVFDVTGAGDTVIGVLAGALATGLSLPEATELANLAAGIVVGKLGTAGVTPEELRGAVRSHQPGVQGVLSEDRLVQTVADARGRGETVVMTNGCFDILHAGHVRFLNQARGLGQRLVVAVNDDDSVNRLKGHGRPINPLNMRMTVLAALGCVDWVVSFSEDTPERLICRVQPDILVKGGDYRPEDIAGGECTKERGGQVRVLGYQDGYSTTGIIEAISGSRREPEPGAEID